VKEALDKLGSDRTVLVIAHRLGTIKSSDNIIVLKEGNINEQGTHDELLAKGGQYANMWNMQLQSTSTSQNSLGLSLDD
jgi:ATP-binding cassette subfamily B protein